MLSYASLLEEKEIEEEEKLFHSTSSLVCDDCKQPMVNESLLDTIIYENAPGFIKEEETKVEDDLESLLKQLMNSLDYELLDDFLITHRGFVSSDTLLRLLLMHFKEAFRQGNDLLKVRLFVILKTWMGRFAGEDFRPSSGRLSLLERELDEVWRVQKCMSDSDRNIMQKLERVIWEARSQSEVKDSGSCSIKEEGKSERSLSDKLKSLFIGRRSAQDEDANVFLDDSTSTTNTTALSELSGSKKLNLLKTSVEEFSMLLTAIDSQYFTRLNWLDLVTFPKINDADGLEESLVQRVIDHFNQVCRFLVSRLLEAPDERKRLKLLVKYVHTAHYLYEAVHNMNGMMAVVLALQNPAVESLTSVWEQLGSKELVMWTSLLRLASPLRSFQKVREEQNSRPGIPFIGLLLSDLMGLSEKTEAPAGVIKFEDWRMVAAKLKQFQSMQQCWSFKAKVDNQKLKTLWNQIYLQ